MVFSRGRGKTEGCIWLGKLATVWDGEVAGVKGALESDKGGLVMTDSQATIYSGNKRSRFVRKG